VQTPPAAASAPARPPLWQAALLALHLAGAAAIGGWIVYSWHALRRLTRTCREADDAALRQTFADLARRLALRRPVRLLIAPDDGSPMAFGVLRPAVLLPRSMVCDLSDDDLAAVLAHELAHHRRRDTWWVLVEDALLLAWWFNPVLWFLVRELRNVREDCCDDLVLATGVIGNAGYCASLVNAAGSVARPRTAHMALGFADRLHPLSRRIQRIMDTTRRRSTRLSVASALVLVVVGLAALPGLRVVGAEEPARAEAPAEKREEVAESRDCRVRGPLQALQPRRRVPRAGDDAHPGPAWRVAAGAGERRFSPRRHDGRRQRRSSGHPLRLRPSG
jgi:bla regulator protein BlaR1